MIKKSTSNKIAISTTLAGIASGVGIGYLAFNNGMPIQIVEEMPQHEKDEEIKNIWNIYDHDMDLKEKIIQDLEKELERSEKDRKTNLKMFMRSETRAREAEENLEKLQNSWHEDQAKWQKERSAFMNQLAEKSKPQQKAPSQPVGYRFNTKEEIDKDFNNRHPGWLKKPLPRNECISHYNKGLYKEDHKQYALDKCQPVATTKPK